MLFGVLLNVVCWSLYLFINNCFTVDAIPVIIVMTIVYGVLSFIFAVIGNAMLDAWRTSVQFIGALVAIVGVFGSYGVTLYVGLVQFIGAPVTWMFWVFLVIISILNGGKSRRR